MSTILGTPSLSPIPDTPVQPHHFYQHDSGETYVQPSPGTWLDPEDDPLAQRGIPVFKPTMDEFRDFEEFMKKIERWGMKSGIVKIIPPKEWTGSLPAITKQQLAAVRIKSPIEQVMLGQAGFFRQENIVKRKDMTVREWTELCRKEDYRAPTAEEVLHNRSDPALRKAKARRGSTVKAESVDPDGEILKKALKGKRNTNQESRAALDNIFLDTFDPSTSWLPERTTAEDYDTHFCRLLERHYWRNCGIGKPAWYGADSMGSLMTEAETSWNIGHLQSTLSRLLPASNGLPGVTTPYLYWGMWRATFSWHVEDMDLFSINYIHFGAPKYWYAVPQAKSTSLEQAMRSHFPTHVSQCKQFLRHKSFLASPTQLAKASCPTNCVVQHAGEFIITYPRGYHAGVNLGLNCAESVNFALDSWIELGRKAKACQCIDDSVKIDVDQLLRMKADDDGCTYDDNAEIPHIRAKITSVVLPAKRKVSHPTSSAPPTKKRKVQPNPSPAPKASTSKLTLKLKIPPEPDLYPCCLCVSMDRDGLLRVYEPPVDRREAVEAAGNPNVWMAHERCASVIPETWVDGMPGEKLVYGVDGIVKDRWTLKCSACTKIRPRAHGAPIQCTKGKCSKAFHVSCVGEDANNNTVFSVLNEVEKEVVLVDFAIAPSSTDGTYVKTIKKLEVEVLCSQHNPVVLAQRKASRQNKILEQLLELPTMSRIKIRVSNGLFEVSFVRVVEETGSVEVLWDLGVKKEFKFSSVILGKTEGPVLQKPSEAVVPPQRPQIAVMPASLYPHLNQQYPGSQQMQMPLNGVPYYAYWPYAVADAKGNIHTNAYANYGGLAHASVPPAQIGGQILQWQANPTNIPRHLPSQPTPVPPIVVQPMSGQPQSTVAFDSQSATP